MLYLIEVTLVGKGQLQKYCNLDSFGLLCSNILTHFWLDVPGVKESALFQISMKCLCNPYWKWSFLLFGA